MPGKLRLGSVLAKKINWTLRSLGKDLCKGPVFCLMGEKILKVKKYKQPREKNQRCQLG